jgi:hypothetical protein
MATWTTIPDSSLEPGKPIRSIDALALRDNPVAIAEGASGAPAIALVAIDDALASQEHLGLGTITVAWNTTTTNVASNGTISGASLRFLSAAVSSATSATAGAPHPDQFFMITSASSTFPTSNTTAMSGTWRNIGGYCRGRLQFGSIPDDVYFWFPSIWLRIA